MLTKQLLKERIMAMIPVKSKMICSSKARDKPSISPICPIILYTAKGLRNAPLSHTIL